MCCAGYLVLRNTTMTSLLNAFANLEHVGVNGNVTFVNGSAYSVVIEGID